MEEEPSKLPNRRRRTLFAILLGIILILAGGTLAWSLVFKSPGPDLFTSSLRQEAPFDLYYPSKLPSGFRANSDSVHYSDKIVTFSVQNKKAESLAVSEQAIPKGFDFAKFYKDSIELPQQTNAPSGKLTTGKLNGLPVCSLVTSTTWIIVSDPSGANSSHLPDICRGLRPVPSP